MKLSPGRTFFFATTVTLLFFFLLELLLRGFFYLGIVEMPRPETARTAWTEAGWKVDKDLNWALIPNHTSRRGGAVCRTNSHGLRDQEVPLAKAPGTYRILVLGDSTVLGFGVPFEQTFSEQLEALLNEQESEVRFQVINAGVPGYSIYNCLTYLKRDGIQFDPDLVILETNFNDRRYILSDEYEDGKQFYHKFYYRLRLKEVLSYSYLDRAMRLILVNTLALSRQGILDTGNFEYEELDLENINCRVEPDRYQKLLQEIIGFLAQRDIPLILVPLKDPPAYVNDYYVASSLAAAGQYEKAVSMLKKSYEIPFYRIIVAKKLNELLDRSSEKDLGIRSIPVPLKWMSTDGNIPVHLSDPYVEIMNNAARQPDVFTINFDPSPPGFDNIYLDYIHLNEDGHRLLAEKLFETMIESVKISKSLKTNAPDE